MHNPGQIVHHITCASRRARARNTTELLSALGARAVLIESGRSIRRRRYPHIFGLPGYNESMASNLVDLYQLSVAAELSEPLIQYLANTFQVNIPGHGTIYAQEGRAFISSSAEIGADTTNSASYQPGMLHDLALITCVMSMSGSGESLAKLALELGTGVPIITLGAGTGLRQRLGLLRITVPAEKEVVRLLVPAVDAEAVVRMLIEKGRLNRPGKGFVYCSPIAAGILDTRLLIGPQQHAATMEQVVAAIDEIEKSTAWRRRFAEREPAGGVQFQRQSDEVVLVCHEEVAEKYVDIAMQAGARAATNTQVYRASINEAAGGAAHKRCSLVIPRSITERVLDALLEAHEGMPSKLETLEVYPVSFTFAYNAEISLT